jgi:hypothetical protein
MIYMIYEVHDFQFFLKNQEGYHDKLWQHKAQNCASQRLANCRCVKMTTARFSSVFSCEKTLLYLDITVCGRNPDQCESYIFRSRRDKGMVKQESIVILILHSDAK